MPKLVPLATLQKVLQNLLIEGVHIRDMRTIIETLAEHAPHTQDADRADRAGARRAGPRDRAAAVPGSEPNCR